MSTWRIAVIGGDGIGPEVIEQAIRVADAAARKEAARLEWDRLPWSYSCYKQTGRMMPEDGWEQLKRHDAILLGAIGSPQVPDHVTLHGLLLPMRRAFDQYVNLRPAYLFEGVQSPLRDKTPGCIDMLVFRENTEGEYAPIGGRLEQGIEEIAIQSAVFTRRGCARIMRAAFAAAGDLVRRPESFDVVVASNLFGDILTDLSAIITGGIGLAASGNINPERTAPSMFEPIHGAAPDIAGKGVANPLAAILSAGLML